MEACGKGIWLQDSGWWWVKVALEVRGQPKAFKFDKVFGGSASQAQVYENTKALIRSVLDGTFTALIIRRKHNQLARATNCDSQYVCRTLLQPQKPDGKQPLTHDEIFQTTCSEFD